MAGALLPSPGVEWLLRRNFWLVKLVGALIVSAFLANTTTTIVALWLFSGPSAPVAEGDAQEGSSDEDPDDAADDAAAAAALAPKKAPAWRDPEKIGARILGRNVFCPECVPEVEGVPSPDAGPAGTPSFDGARRTALPLELAATMESTDPTFSLATIKNLQGGFAGLYGAGDELATGVQIVAIAAGRVDLLNQGQPEYLEFGAMPQPPPAPKSVPARKTETVGKPVVSAGIDGADEAIKCDGGGCQVEREFVEGLIAKPQLLVGQGSARAAKTASGEDGFRLGGVKKGSLPDLLGLKTGDIITEVGGQPLTYDSLMALYPKLRNAKHIEVTVDRKGERLSKALEIVS